VLGADPGRKLFKAESRPRLAAAQRKNVGALAPSALGGDAGRAKREGRAYMMTCERKRAPYCERSEHLGERSDLKRWGALLLVTNYRESYRILNYRFVLQSGRGFSLVAPTKWS
jgi:hypothetical protein